MEIIIPNYTAYAYTRGYGIIYLMPILYAVLADIAISKTP